MEKHRQKQKQILLKELKLRSFNKSYIWSLSASTYHDAQSKDTWLCSTMYELLCNARSLPNWKLWWEAPLVWAEA